MTITNLRGTTPFVIAAGTAIIAAALLGSEALLGIVALPALIAARLLIWGVVCGVSRFRLTQ